MVKFKVDFDEQANQPILKLETNTAADSLEDKIFRQFIELANTQGNVLALETAAVANGTTITTIKIEAV